MGRTGTHADRGLLAPPFGVGWLRRLEQLVVGVPVGHEVRSRLRAQFVCWSGEEVRPWAVDVADGRVRRVRAATSRDSTTVIVHSLNVGWRLLGLAVRGFHRLDEFVLEQCADGRWARRLVPPLDDVILDLSPSGQGGLVWHERIVGSPVGTVFVTRHLVEGRLAVRDASTKPPSTLAAVSSEVAFAEVMTARRSNVVDATPRRAWRGHLNDRRLIGAALARTSGAAREVEAARIQRDQAVLDGLHILRAMADALGGTPGWRSLWLPSVARPRDRGGGGG